MRVLTKEQTKNIEKNAAIEGLEYIRMMENAGSAAAKRIVDSYPVAGSRIAVLCGRGNNGGDGLVVARKLYDAGALVTIILAEGMPQTAEAREMYTHAYHKVKNIIGIEDRRRLESVILEAGVVVDAVHGTGFHGIISESTAALFDIVNQSQAVRIALDLPSGMECDTGRFSPGCFIADYTLSFIALKPSHVLEPSRRLCGSVESLSIGIPQSILNQAKSMMHLVDWQMIKEQFIPRNPDSHKGSFGRPLLICGSTGMAGSARLAALGALRSGAGIVHMAVPSDIYFGALAVSLTEPVFTLLPAIDGHISSEAYPLIESLLPRASACLIGSGLGQSHDAAKNVAQLIQNCEIPIVLDADGINCMVGNINIIKNAKAPVIMTPHPGEMARFTGQTIEQIQADRIGSARMLAAESGAIVVLKGRDTVTALPSGKVYINTTGNPGMATGGSGDVLGGIIVSLIGQGIKPEMAAVCGVYIHGSAGDRASARLSQHSMLPSDLIDELSGVFLELES